MSWQAWNSGSARESLNQVLPHILPWSTSIRTVHLEFRAMGLPYFQHHLTNRTLEERSSQFLKEIAAIVNCLARLDHVELRVNRHPSNNDGQLDMLWKGLLSVDTRLQFLAIEDSQLQWHALSGRLIHSKEQLRDDVSSSPDVLSNC